MESEAYDCIFKIIIIGNGSSGKSSLLSYYLTGKRRKEVLYNSRQEHLSNSRSRIRMQDHRNQGKTN